MRARIAVSILVIMAIVSGCSDCKAAFLTALEMVDPKPMLLKAENNVVGWHDGETAFVFSLISSKDIFVAIRNNGSTSLRILWDDATIVLPGGAVSRALHGQVRIMDAQRSVAPTVVPPDADWTGVIIPVSQVQWNTASRSYVAAPMWPDPSHPKWVTAKYEAAAAYDGQQMRLTLPIQRGEQTTEYRFAFQISVARAD